MNDRGELYEGQALLRKLSRRASEWCPPYMQRGDLIHAGWLALSDARSSGKNWGYAKKAAWGAMMNELSKWIGVPPRGAERLNFVQYKPIYEDVAEEQRARPRLADVVLLKIPKLAPRQRACITKYLAGDTLTEIGREFGISPGNVLTHLKAGCAKLKTMLDAEAYVWSASPGAP
jgi:RNA polymerase sigma factor (sigma-70 family)